MCAATPPIPNSVPSSETTSADSDWILTCSSKSEQQTLVRINHGEHGEYGEADMYCLSPCSPCSPWLICLSQSRLAAPEAYSEKGRFTPPNQPKKKQAGQFAEHAFAY